MSVILLVLVWGNVGLNRGRGHKERRRNTILTHSFTPTVQTPAEWVCALQGNTTL